MFVRRIFTLFRAYEAEAGQAMIDAHALRILTGLMAREMADRRAHDAADRRAQEYEAYALKALETGEDAIARQCAEVVAAAETERQRYGDNLEATRRLVSLRAGIDAADEKNGAFLRGRLSDAGIARDAPHTADAVLARLKVRLSDGPSYDLKPPIAA